MSDKLNYWNFLDQRGERYLQTIVPGQNLYIVLWCDVGSSRLAVGFGPIVGRDSGCPEWQVFIDGMSYHNAFAYPTPTSQFAAWVRARAAYPEGNIAYRFDDALLQSLLLELRLL